MLSSLTTLRRVSTVLAAVACLHCSLSGNGSQVTLHKRDSASQAQASQPLAFSHKLHSEQKLECAFCHENPDPGEAMSIPDAEFCMNCHETIAADKPAIRELAQFARTKKPIEWVRMYSLPAFVFWSHRTHLGAGQQCAACHGDVTQMEIVHPTNVTTMDACVECHDKKDANTGCATCHESRTS